MSFPNRAGDHPDTDEILKAELLAAGIDVYQNDWLKESSGEVKTSVMGTLHGWTFKRAWYYWCASGPGIDVHTAERLHATHGKDVRVDGHCGCPSPREWYHGLACGSYHVDSPEGLKALADTIRGLVNSKKPDPIEVLKMVADAYNQGPDPRKVRFAMDKVIDYVREVIDIC